MERLFTINKVAEILSVSRRTVYRLIKEAHLPTVLVLNRYRIRQKDLSKYIESLSQEEPEYKELERRVKAYELSKTKQP